MYLLLYKLLTFSLNRINPSESVKAKVLLFIYEVILIPEMPGLKIEPKLIYIQAPRCVTATSHYVARIVGQKLEGESSASRTDWPQPLTATSKYGTDAPFIKVKTRSARDQFQSSVPASR